MKLLKRMALTLGLFGLAMTPASARYHHHYRDHHRIARTGYYDAGNYYIAVSGHRVHGPMQAQSRPNGATARCRDQSWSFSESRRGICSHHGGVGRWL